MRTSRQRAAESDTDLLKEAGAGGKQVIKTKPVVGNSVWQ